MILFILVEGLALVLAGAFIMQRFGEPVAAEPGHPAPLPERPGWWRLPGPVDVAGGRLILAGFVIQLCAVVLAIFE
ncbi:MAG: hypothetical protein EPO67_11160 [Reyranella sp.]|nr:MAG: hypothetical protein EPO67_11160 [Reyranella sp.]